MALFESICAASGLDEPIAEFMFAPPRRFRFDYCWPERKIALEIEGGVFTRGRHTRPMGFLRDIEKYNLAAILGYRVIRCTPDEMKSGSIITTLQKAMPNESHQQSPAS